MSESYSPTLERKPLTPAARLLWAALIVATLWLCYFSNLGVLGFMGPDEPRYAWIAREMHESGDWITPRLYGQPWFEKPVLYYWGAALSFKLFGVSVAAARLPSAFAALLATLAMAWLVWRCYGALTARWLLLFLPSSVAMIGFSHSAATDMPFTAMLTIALVCAAEVVGITRSAEESCQRGTPYLAFVLFGFFLGLAVLAKGPAAIILSGGAVFFWAVFSKRWRDAFRCFHPVAIVSFALTALPWYVAVSRRNPDFFRIFIIEHNFKRYLTPEFQHVQPFWYYLPVVLIAMMPWTVALLALAAVGTRKLIRNFCTSSPTAFFLCWALFCLVFFTTSKSKLPGYVLPAVPAIAALLAHAYIKLAPQFARGFQFTLLLSSSLLSPTAVALWYFPARHGGPRAAMASSIAWVLIAFAAVSLLLAISEARSFGISLWNPLAIVPICVCLATFSALSRPFLRPLEASKVLNQLLVSAQLPPGPLFADGMHRSEQYALSFSLHREIAKWDRQHPQEGLLLLHGKSCQDIVSTGFSCKPMPVNLQSTNWNLFEVKRQP